MKNIKELLDKYISIEEKLHELFKFHGYWKMLPIDDMSERYWFVANHNNVIWHEEPINKQTIEDVWMKK